VNDPESTASCAEIRRGAPGCASRVRDAADVHGAEPPDLGAMRALGLDIYRFPVSWSHVAPQGPGSVDRAALAAYDRFTDALLGAGILPFPTLYGKSLPRLWDKRGGWAMRETAEQFAQYALIVAGVLGDRVSRWATLDAPSRGWWIGRLHGRAPQDGAEWGAAVRAAYHMHLGHGHAVRALRSAVADAQVGMVSLAGPCEPATASEADRAAATRADGHVNRWWLDPLYGRGYPADMLELYGLDLPVRPGDLELIAEPLDWLGVSYLTRMLITDDPRAPVPHAASLDAPGARYIGMGWEVHAASLEQVLLRLTRDYGAGQIYVAESGCADPDPLDPDGTVHDPDRAAYLDSHLTACARAARSGAPVAGYFASSVPDSYTPPRDFTGRVGLVGADDPAQGPVAGSGLRAGRSSGR
jgi:beta-glucosidase